MSKCSNVTLFGEGKTTKSNDKEITVLIMKSFVHAFLFQIFVHFVHELSKFTDKKQLIFIKIVAIVYAFSAYTYLLLVFNIAIINQLIENNPILYIN